MSRAGNSTEAPRPTADPITGGRVRRIPADESEIPAGQVLVHNNIKPGESSRHARVPGVDATDAGLPGTVRLWVGTEVAGALPRREWVAAASSG